MSKTKAADIKFTKSIKCFCYSCGHIGFNPVEVVEKIWSDGDRSITPVNKDERYNCNKCNKKSFVVFNQYNMPLAVEFLLKNMYQIKQAQSSEAITFLANILDVK